VYCVVPRDLSEKLFDDLRTHFRARPDVEVVVERRTGDRRARGSRRTAPPEARDDAERRRIRSASGRRILERRALTVPCPTPPSLPRKANRYAKRLVFLERLEPSSQQVRDADSKRLVVRYQTGDEAVFGDLYLRYFNHVYSYARVALAEHHEAEDVTQQVFIRALSALARYELRPNVAFRGWLFAIARNVIVDVLKERHGLYPEAPDQLDVMRDQAPAYDEVEVAETLGWLSDREVGMFVERLPLPQRQVLVLRFMLDLSGEEIAQALGRSPNSVRKLQQRALESLQRRLIAVGRIPPRRGGVPMLVRIRPLPVMGQRRFALGRSGSGRRFAA
jgi:RNA polymerase sigma-70 factor (ECF subfamily)